MNVRPYASLITMFKLVNAKARKALYLQNIVAFKRIHHTWQVIIRLAEALTLILQNIQMWGVYQV